MTGKIVGPSRVPIDGEGFFHFFYFSFLFGFSRWNKTGSARQRTNCCIFVAEGCVRVKWYVLVCMGRFPVYIKRKRAIGVAGDGYIEHCDGAVLFLLFCPFDVRMDAVDECEEGCDVVFVDGCDCIIRFSEPEQNDVGCCHVIVSGFIVLEGLLFEVLHEQV